VQLERAVDAYLRHISIERGLSDHTVAAYRRDLAGYVAWLSARGIRDSSDVTVALVTAFAAELPARAPVRISREHTAHRFLTAREAARRFLWDSQRQGLAAVRDQVLRGGPRARALEIEVPVVRR